MFKKCEKCQSDMQPIEVIWPPDHEEGRPTPVCNTWHCLKCDEKHLEREPQAPGFFRALVDAWEVKYGPGR